MICSGCGYEYDDSLGRYGCPNCLGEETRGDFKMRKQVKDALAIDELAYTLDNISNDDKKAIEDYTDDEILAEARYVLGLFHESGHINNEALQGDEGPDQKRWAKGQVRKLQAYIAKYSKVAA